MNFKTLTQSTVVLALALSGLAACSDDDDAAPTLADQTTPGSVANFLASDPRFTVVAEVANQTGLLSTLDTTSGITVFAPTDAAFNALPDEFLVTQNFVSAGDPNDITSSISAAGLTILLQAHVVAQELSSETVAGGESFDTLAGSAISVQNAGSLILNARAQVLEADISLQNGTVHVIDTVFVPTTELAAAGELDADAFPGTLFDFMESSPLHRQVLGALQEAGENDVLTALADPDSEQTVFVPADGIADAPATFFDLHAVPGSQTAADLIMAGFTETASFTQLTVSSSTPATIEGVNILATDLATSNGVIHLIEGVIPTPSQSVADLITTNRNFSTLGAVLNMVDVDATTTLLDTLRGDGDTFTVFAPTNAAFDALATLDYDADMDSASTFVDELLANTSSISDVLTYHVAAGTVDPTMTTTITTALGQDIIVSTLGTLTVLNGLIEFGDATETTGSNNSVIYEMSNVLIPPMGVLQPGVEKPQDVFPGPTSAALAYFSAFSGFSGAIGDASVPYNAPTTDGSTVAFGGTLADIFRFVEDDPALLVDAMDATFEGELVAPYAADTTGDDAVNANFEIENTTVFVPLNASLPDDVSGDVLPYHAAFGALQAADLTTGMVDTLTVDDDGNTGKFAIDVDVSMGVTLNGTANVILPDLVTDNGVIHVISEALVPPAEGN